MGACILCHVVFPIIADVLMAELTTTASVIGLDVADHRTDLREDVHETPEGELLELLTRKDSVRYAFH